MHRGSRISSGGGQRASPREPRPGSRDGGRLASLARPISGRKLSKSGKGGGRGPPPVASRFYTISQCTGPTYLAMLKSDIFQVQMRLEKAISNLGDQQNARMLRPLSARHREIQSITTSTAEVDAITGAGAGSEDPRVRLRMSELLAAKMVHLENAILKYTEKAAAPGQTGGYGSPSNSRLPSYLTLLERVVSFYHLIVRKHRRSSTSAISSPKSAPLGGEGKRRASGGGLADDSQKLLADLLNEAESQVELLEAELETTTQPSRRGAGSKKATPSASGFSEICARIKELGAAAGRVKDQGVRYLQNEIESLKATNSGIGEALDRAKKDVAACKAQLKNAEDTAQASQAEATKLQLGGEKRQRDLQGEVEDLKRLVQLSKERGSQESTGLISTIEKMRANLKRAQERERTLAEEHSLSMEKEKTQWSGEVQSLKTALAECKLDASRAHEKCLNAEKAREEVEAKMGSASRELGECKARFSALREDRAHSHEGLEERLRIAEERNAALREAMEASSTSKPEGSSSAEVASAPNGEAGSEAKLLKSLRDEVAQTKKQLGRTQRSLEGMELYVKDVQTTKDMELSELRGALRDARQELSCEREQWADEKDVLQSHVDALKATVDKMRASASAPAPGGAGGEAAEIGYGGGASERAFEEVLREEMRVMKASFELKVSQLNEKVASQSRSHVRQVRQLQDKLAEAQRALSKAASSK